MRRQVEVKLLELHPAQQEIVACPARFRVLACGRRFGKTEVLMDELAQALIDGLTCAYLAPTYRMTVEVWEAIKARLRPLIRKVNEGDMTMLLMNGGHLDVWSLTTKSAQTIRGRHYHLLAIDEASVISDSTIWPEVLLPTLADYSGRALFASTPRGHNWFWQLFNLGLDATQNVWRSFHKTIEDNPYIKRNEVELARNSMGERSFQQEYMAEFLPDAGTVFRGVGVVSTGYEELTPEEGHEYAFGVDWGRSEDFTAIAIWDITEKRQVRLERFREIGWSLQRGRLSLLSAQWKPLVIVAEENSVGDVNIEALQAEGLPVQPFLTTAQSKPPLIESLALAIEKSAAYLQGDEAVDDDYEPIELLADPYQVSELQAFSMERRTNGWRYSAPAGLHDDAVIALALGYRAITHGTGSLLDVW